MFAESSGNDFEKVIELVYVCAPNLWGYLKNGVLRACDEVCGKNSERGYKVYSWQLNEDVKEERCTQGDE